MQSVNLEELGLRIKDRRERLNLSQQTLAEKSGVYSTTIGRIERGDLCPSIDIIFRLAISLGVSIDYLCGNEYVVSQDELILLSPALKLSNEDYELVTKIAKYLSELLKNR